MPRSFLYILVFASGIAALSWEILWQIKASLALGVSALGTALTIAVTIGGMSLGSAIMGRTLEKRTFASPTRLYGMLEIIIGLAGLTLPFLFERVQLLDSWAYIASPNHYPLFHIAGIIAALGVPTTCMGATFPVFGLLSRQPDVSIAQLYSLNTLGGACGVMLAAFIGIPLLGVTHTGLVIAAINITVGIILLMQRPIIINIVPKAISNSQTSGLGPKTELWVVAVTGFATFALEVAWFRELTAAFHNRTDTFGILLGSVLLALGAAGQAVTFCKRRSFPLGILVAISGVLILAVTPLVERFDHVTVFQNDAVQLLLSRFFMTLVILGIPMLLLGVALPWIIAGQGRASRWGGLYALNAFSSILGSIGAAWFLLPTIGATHTAWLAGLLAAGTGIAIAPANRRLLLAAAICCGLFIAVGGESGAGKTTVQGLVSINKIAPNKILEYYEGPDATVAAVEYPYQRRRALIIDGFAAALQFDDAVGSSFGHYMAWMGHLPMLLHPNPKDALVICFGTGQTSNAVRRENPEHLDIVDINPHVFKLGHNFENNQNVLGDPRVTPIVMDGRAYMRRVQKTYDVITLEPMPPNFSGVNALYSTEFYQYAANRLRPGGMIAQWLPFHLIAPYYSASIVKTFHQTFPNALLWIDPLSQTGILVGSKGTTTALGTKWPGFARNPIDREHDAAAVQAAVLMQGDQLDVFDRKGQIISDDNQLLAYGEAVFTGYTQYTLTDNLAYIGLNKP